VPMMATASELRYAAGNGWRAVEIPYIGGSLAMTMIVPDDLAAFQATLGANKLAEIVGQLRAFEVTLHFPKFRIETKAMLADVLGALGMPSAFDPNRADFSGITAQEALFISDVVHQANIDVDEKGTEAAAATAVVLRGTASPGQVTLTVDRPFLFVLRDVPTGAALFLGRVSDPSIGY
jgi:serpin B